ncbi:PilZ domain-containing protein [Sphingomonas sp. BN140010]|uniref:PilZ domain-containing protein n=1 Tax=Sphingomonas arvum TaxID=2992113 RepID=A0ABT3JCP8_9SPHN|nr:PilZ domain-containing protein [Sphingomonas sp. BN140010]MCW3796851.1 PilZ domain-containing protein [Sphingomonas sp. BN140010]
MRKRQSIRCSLKGEIILRRSAVAHYLVEVRDVSRHGCRVAVADVPKLDEQVMIRFEGLEPLPATVCWVRAFDVGVEFARPIHPAVFDHLTRQFGARCPDASSY